MISTSSTPRPPARASSGRSQRERRRADRAGEAATLVDGSSSSAGTTASCLNDVHILVTMNWRALHVKGARPNPSRRRLPRLNQLVLSAARHEKALNDVRVFELERGSGRCPRVGTPPPALSATPPRSSGRALRLRRLRRQARRQRALHLRHRDDDVVDAVARGQGADRARRPHRLGGRRDQNLLLWRLRHPVRLLAGHAHPRHRAAVVVEALHQRRAADGARGPLGGGRRQPHLRYAGANEGVPRPARPRHGHHVVGRAAGGRHRAGAALWALGGDRRQGDLPLWRRARRPRTAPTRRRTGARTRRRASTCSTRRRWRGPSPTSRGDALPRYRHATAMVARRCMFGGFGGGADFRALDTGILDEASSTPTEKRRRRAGAAAAARARGRQRAHRGLDGLGLGKYTRVFIRGRSTSAASSLWTTCARWATAIGPRKKLARDRRAARARTGALLDGRPLPGPLQARGDASMGGLNRSSSHWT